MKRKASKPKPPTFRSCLECGGQSVGLLCDGCAHRLNTPCARCKINNAGATGVCEPCFQWWLKQNEDIFAHPYGGINGLNEPLIPTDEKSEPRFQQRKNIWHGVDLALQAMRKPEWPAPRLVATDPPPAGRALIWIGSGLNEWRSVEILPAQDDDELGSQILYMLDSGHIEYARSLGPNAYWLPMPPAIEADHA